MTLNPKEVAASSQAPLRSLTLRNSAEAKWGTVLLGLGTLLILVRVRPISDFYFPYVWLGFILLLDASVARGTGTSLAHQRRSTWMSLFIVSSILWWLFEAFDQVVHNWTYMGAGNYNRLAYIAIASVDFSTVVPAVLASAACIFAVLPSPPHRSLPDRRVPPRLLFASFATGVACIGLPLAWPTYGFGLIWGAMFVLLDPINAALGRPSVIHAMVNCNFRLPFALGTGSLVCGFFWEAWNFWSTPKWVYDIPYVGFWHVFEMPILGWFGYLPFGLELFAMTNFVLPMLFRTAVSEDLRWTDTRRFLRREQR